MTSNLSQEPLSPPLSVCVPIPYPDVSTFSLPPGWKRDVAISGTGVVMAAAMLTPLPPWQKICLAGAIGSGMSMAWNGYAAATTGRKVLRGDDSPTTAKKLKFSVILAAVSSVAFALFQSRIGL